MNQNPIATAATSAVASSNSPDNMASQNFVHQGPSMTVNSAANSNNDSAKNNGQKGDCCVIFFLRQRLSLLFFKGWISGIQVKSLRFLVE